MHALWRRLSGAGGSGGDEGSVRVANASEQAKLDRLAQMGFDQSPALYALRQAHGNVDAAIELLLNAPTPADAARERRASASAAAAQSRRDQMQHTRREQQQQQQQPRGAQSLQQASRPPQPQRQSQERVPSGGGSALAAQLDAACGALCEFPAAVDTLLYVLSTLLAHPGDAKFREIKKTNRRFRETVAPAGAAGARLLLLAGFQEAGDWFVLRGREDAARLWTAHAALEAAQRSPLYQLARDRAEFEAALAASLDSADAEERRRRRRFESGVPAAPAEGAAGTTRVRVFLGGGRHAQRAFNADDVVDGVVSWLGAAHSSLLPDKLRSGAWELVDATLFPERVVDLDAMGQSTLQAAGMWPGAELRVQPAGTLRAKEDRERGLLPPA